ncbi:hypothetical protein BU17DRAFT_69706 [Hysterangium stoloniferum]|nr:hypothetical protein BU17DRAFT_69706 [Hysterangium stoloniferum]
MMFFVFRILALVLAVSAATVRVVYDTVYDDAYGKTNIVGAAGPPCIMATLYKKVEISCPSNWDLVEPSQIFQSNYRLADSHSTGYIYETGPSLVMPWYLALIKVFKAGVFRYFAVTVSGIWTRCPKIANGTVTDRIYEEITPKSTVNPAPKQFS